MHLGHADAFSNFLQRAKVVADVAPGVVRGMAAGDRARAVHRLLTLDLVRDDIERFVPADPLVAGYAAILGIAFAVRIEIHALHRVEQSIGRVDNRLDVLPVRRERGLARRRESLPLRLMLQGCGSCRRR